MMLELDQAEGEPIKCQGFLIQNKTFTQHQANNHIYSNISKLELSGWLVAVEW